MYSNKMKHYYAAEPLDTNTDIIFLNQERDIENARDFFKTCDSELAHSLDPRLIDPIRNIHMRLDRPPLQPRNVQPLRNIYDCDNDIRPRIYNDGYKSMYPGDYQYYVDPYLAQAYNEPVYVAQQTVIPFVFEDPMGALKPQYDRVPNFQNNTSISEYSFDQDQMSYREDLMARQSRKMNQSNYQLFQGHFIPEN